MPAVQGRTAVICLVPVPWYVTSAVWCTESTCVPKQRQLGAVSLYERVRPESCGAMRRSIIQMLPGEYYSTTHERWSLAGGCLKGVAHKMRAISGPSARRKYNMAATGGVSCWCPLRTNTMCESLARAAGELLVRAQFFIQTQPIVLLSYPIMYLGPRQAFN